MRSNGPKIIGAVIIITALLGWWGYHTWLRPDPSVGKQLAEQFGDDFFTPNSIDSLPAAENNTSADDSSITEDFLADRGMKRSVPINGDPVPDASLPIAGENSGTPIAESNNGERPVLQVTEKVIMDKYAPKFSALEQFTNSHLDQIYAAAVKEYGEKSKAGTLNHAAWTQKYLQACLKLQDSVNPQFYGLVNEMEAELKANNLSTAVIDEIKQEYTAGKYRKIKELLARAHGE